MLKRLKKSINTILLFIRAFEIACLVVKRKEEKSPNKTKKKAEDSIMGTSKTVLGEILKFENSNSMRNKREEEIDYEMESIPLETSDISFESLEELDDVITGKTEVTEKSKETLKKLEGTELGFDVKNRISSLLDQVELIKDTDANLADLSALFD